MIGLWSASIKSVGQGIDLSCPMAVPMPVRTKCCILVPPFLPLAIEPSTLLLHHLPYVDRQCCLTVEKVSMLTSMANKYG